MTQPSTPPANPVPDVTYGETSKFRFMVLDAPTTVRPANFDALALELPELTTSDMPATVSTKTDPIPRMYGTPAAGKDVSWQKPRPDTGSWTVTLSGNVMPTPEQREAMETLFAAIGRYVWVEREGHTETVYEGGCALVTSKGKPIPADAVVTFSAGLTGYGPLYPDTALAV